MNYLTQALKIKYPIIAAPMFLVSNIEMLKAAHKAGISGAIPSLNYKTDREFENALIELTKECEGNFGINLIANKSNIHLKNHLELLEKYPPRFVITSLGSPEEIIKKLKPKGTLIFCDVVDLSYAKKVEELGADALIAVNSGAGGHAGNIPATILIPLLVKNCKIPVIAAGGVGTTEALKSMLTLGAVGVSIGSPFIATKESAVSMLYKQACVDYGAGDIVMMDKISGTPCSVINTPYVKKIGTKLSLAENLLLKNKQLKKYIKMLTYFKGMKSVENAAFKATYKTVWVAGPSIEFTTKISDVSEVVSRLTSSL